MWKYYSTAADTTTASATFNHFLNRERCTDLLCVQTLLHDRKPRKQKGFKILTWETSIFYVEMRYQSLNSQNLEN